MEHSTAAVVTAAFSAAVVGGVLLVVLLLMARRSPVWVLRLSPLVAILSVTAGVISASLTMLLTPDQVLLLAIVLAVSTPIALAFGVVAGRRGAALQAHAAQEAADRQRDRVVEERRRELITWLSHDLRTPLARMRALTEAQEDGLAPPDYSTRMLSEVDGLAVVIDDIATLSRLQAPSLQLVKQSLELADIASDCVAGNKPLAHQLHLTLEVHAHGNTLVLADAAEMMRAVNNLVVNALRHTRPNGFVFVTANGDEKSVHLVVRDQCGGIPSNHLEHVFEAGWRGTSARTPGDEGAGLGLSITDRIVAAHGGDVKVSNSVDGCEFTITLPVPTRIASHSV